MLTQQRDIALEKAERYRMMQAELKRSLRRETFEEGKRVVRGIVRDPAPELGAMKIETLLRAIRAVGEDKAAAYCRKARLHPTVRLRELRERERDRLVKVLL